MQDVKVRVNEHYGDALIPLEFPDGWKLNVTEMACKGAQPMTDEEIRGALDNTVGAANIAEQAKGKKGRIVVTCDDLSRPTPAGRVFPFIVEQLHEAGVSDHQIFILGSIIPAMIAPKAIVGMQYTYVCAAKFVEKYIVLSRNSHIS